MSTDKRHIDRRTALRGEALGGLGLAGLGSLTNVLDISNAFASGVGSPGGPLVAAARKEGRLNVITIPLHGWADYDEIMATFRAR